ncbi:MAG: DUF4350 domain-containing protein [Clostridiales bacterium]|jgi:hypothetical protein|nr:DUF4350 domain-containing protein [Clostridiales bacterium]
MIKNLVTAICSAFIAALTLAGCSPGFEESFTSFSAYGDGVSLLSDTLKEMGFSIGVSRRKIDAETPVSHAAIIVEPYAEYFGDQEIAEAAAWVARGGRLILMEDEMSGLEPYMNTAPYSEDDYFYRIRYGMGEVLVGYSSDILNDYLVIDSYAGEFIRLELERWNADKAVFYEYYHGYQDNGGQPAGFFSSLPSGARVTLIQLAIAAVMIIWLLGKRFGKPMTPPPKEAAERGFISNMAIIFKSAGKGDMAVESLYNEFLRECAAFFATTHDFARDNVRELWRRRDLPYARELSIVLGVVESGNECDARRAVGRATLVKTAAYIEKLTDAIKTRYYH